MLAAKARAILQGRYHATTGDIAAMALPVLRHRLIPSFNAEATGQNSDDIIQQAGRGNCTQHSTDPEPASPPPVPPSPPLLRRVINDGLDRPGEITPPLTFRIAAHELDP